MYQVCYTRHQGSLYLWLIASVLKYCKVRKHYDQNCAKMFLLPSKLPMMIQVSVKTAHFVQTSQFCQKLPISNGESFPELIFDLN